MDQCRLLQIIGLFADLLFETWNSMKVSCVFRRTQLAPVIERSVGNIYLQHFCGCVLFPDPLDQELTRVSAKFGYPQIKIPVSHKSIGSWQHDRNCQHVQLYCRYIIKGGSAEIYVNHRFVKEACLPAGKCPLKNGNRKVVGTFL